MTRRDERDWGSRDDDNWDEQRERNERRFGSENDGRTWNERGGQYGAQYAQGSQQGYGGTYGPYARHYGPGEFSGGRGGYTPQGFRGPSENRYGSENRFGSGSGQQWGGPQREWDSSSGTGGFATTLRGGFAGKGPRGYIRSDERIKEDVSDRLSMDDEVDASDITVTVSQGEVTLEGTVPDRHSKRHAEDIVENVSGVKDVHNKLRANKGLVQEVGDKIMGRETTEHGHSGSGTRNAPAGTSTTHGAQPNGRA